MTSQCIYSFEGKPSTTNKEFIKCLSDFLLKDYSNRQLSEMFGCSIGIIKSSIQIHGLQRHKSHTKKKPPINKKYSVVSCIDASRVCSSLEEFSERFPGHFHYLRKMRRLHETGLKKLKIKNFPEFALKIIYGLYFPCSEVSYNDRSLIEPYEIDLCDYTEKISIEYDGQHWHVESKNDEIKNKLVTELGFRMIRIPERKKDRRNQILNILSALQVHLGQLSLTEEDVCDVIFSNYYLQTENDPLELVQKYDSARKLKKDHPKEYLFLFRYHYKEFRKFKDFRYKFKEGEILEILKTCNSKSEFIKMKGLYGQMKKGNMRLALEYYENVLPYARPRKETLPLFFLDMRIEVKNKPEVFLEYLEQGWSIRVTKERRTHNAATSNKNRTGFKSAGKKARLLTSNNEILDKRATDDVIDCEEHFLELVHM